MRELLRNIKSRPSASSVRDLVVYGHETWDIALEAMKYFICDCTKILQCCYLYLIFIQNAIMIFMCAIIHGVGSLPDQSIWWVNLHLTKATSLPMNCPL